MDDGTDATEILTNKVIPLKLGYVAVVNRSQSDINKNLSVRDGNAKEKLYFAKHGAYRKAESRCGTHNLARICNQLLVKHIKEVLPDIKAKISQMVKETDANLAALGEGTESFTQSQLVGCLLQLISKFSTSFRDNLEARSSGSSNINITELSGGARITYVFKEIYGRRLASFQSLDGLSDDNVRTAIANANGLRPAMMMPEQAFDLLIRKEILRLEAPSIQCLEFVYDELLRMVAESFPSEMRRFPVLKDRVGEIVNSHLRALLAPAQAMIKNLILCELAYLNTSHPDYISSGRAVVEANNMLEMTKPKPAAGPASEGSGHHSARGMSPVRGGSGGGGGGGGGSAASTTLTPPGGDSRPQSVPAPAAAAMATSSPMRTAGGFNLWSFGAGVLPGGAGAGASSAVANTTQKGNSSVSANASSAAPAASRGVGGDSSLIKLSSVPDCITKSSVPPNDREKLEMLTIRVFVDSYFSIVKKNVMDLVPKTIMHFMVNAFRDSLADHLNVELHSAIGAKDSDLLRERGDVSEQRAQFREIRDMLHKVTHLIVSHLITAHGTRHISRSLLLLLLLING
jgi:dynamin 1-like protein